jgi:hypothetical protein
MCSLKIQFWNRVIILFCVVKKLKVQLVISGNGIEVVSKSTHSSALSEGTHSFSYDHVFGQNASTEHLYATVPQKLQPLHFLFDHRNNLPCIRSL